MDSKHSFALVAILALLLVSVPADGYRSKRPPALDDERLMIEVFYSGRPLARPISFDFVGDEKILVIEKESGIVRLIEPGKKPVQVLDRPVSLGHNGGGLGLVVDPEFENNKHVYVFHTIARRDGGHFIKSQVARYTLKRLNKGTPKLTKRKIIMSLPRDPSQANSDHHYGGYIRFGPDGKIYGIIGDADRGRGDNPRIEQNTSQLDAAGAGGIFRINPDGSIPADNPWADHEIETMRKWYVIGIRNGFGLDFEPITGELWFTENGPDSYDEINRAGAGMNSGWLMIMGPDSRNAVYDANNATARNAADLLTVDGATYRDPVFSFLVPVGVTSIAFLGNSALPKNLRDSAIVADVVTGNLYLFEQTNDRQDFVLTGSLADRVADNDSSRSDLVWGTDVGQIVDIRIGPDGFVYLSDTSSDTIYRIRPK